MRIKTFSTKEFMLEFIKKHEIYPLRIVYAAEKPNGFELVYK